MMKEAVTKLPWKRMLVQFLLIAGLSVLASFIMMFYLIDILVPNKTITFSNRISAGQLGAIWGPFLAAPYLVLGLYPLGLFLLYKKSLSFFLWVLLPVAASFLYGHIIGQYLHGLELNLPLIFITTSLLLSVCLWLLNYLWFSRKFNPAASNLIQGKENAPN